MPRRSKVAYIMSRFPHLPETFILREMQELRRLGWEIALYPLVVQESAVVHDEARAWMPEVRCPGMFRPGIIGRALMTLVRQPIRMASLLGEVIWHNRASPGFLLRGLMMLPKAACVAGMMKREGVEHIHAHYGTHSALFAYLVHRLTGISYSVTVHAHDIFVCRAMLGTKLRHAEFVVAISEFNREYLGKRVGLWVREKTHVIRCGIDPDQYASAGGSPRSGGVFEIFSIGSLQPYKGFAHLIRACELLRDRDINFRCRIVGEGVLRQELQAMIDKAGMGDRVELVGAKTQQEVAGMLPEADCYVQPSVVTPSGKMEGIPVAIMEALACARPVVSSKLSGIPELVEDGLTGYLVPPGDAEALCERLALVHAEPDSAKRLGMVGRARVLDEYRLDQNVDRLAGLFKDTILVKQT